MSTFHHTVRTVTPFHDRSRSSRLVKIALWLLGTAVVLALCVVKVLLPSFGSWVAKLIVIAIFLAAYSIPVTFHTVMSVVGGNSLANTVSFTPGGVGITQAVNSVSLSSVTTTENATAYSLGAAAHRHRVERLLRSGARDLGLRLDGREAARRNLLHRSEGEGSGAVRSTQGPQGREEGGEAGRQAGGARRRTGRLNPQIGSKRSSRSTLSTSATDHAWKGQPVAVCGAAPFAVSEIEPMPHSVRCASRPSRIPVTGTPT